MILLNWERTEGGKKKKNHHNNKTGTRKLNHPKFPTLLKVTSSAGFPWGIHSLWAKNSGGVRCSQINILRVIPVEQDTLNEAFCASSGTREKFADFEVLEMWPPLQQPQNLVEMTRKTNFHRGNRLAPCCPSRRRHFSLILAFLKQCSNTALGLFWQGNQLWGTWGWEAFGVWLPKKNHSSCPGFLFLTIPTLNGFRFDMWIQLKSHYFYNFTGKIDN